MNQWAKFRTQLILLLLLTTTSLGLVGWLIARGEVAAASFCAIPAVGMATRLLVLLRLHRMGSFAEDPAHRPPLAAANRQLSVVYLVQIVCWLAAAGLAVATRFWIGLAIAVFLALMSLSMTIMLRRPPQQPATSSTPSPQTDPGE